MNLLARIELEGSIASFFLIFTQTSIIFLPTAADRRGFPMPADRIVSVKIRYFCEDDFEVKPIKEILPVCC